jgi:hypothetical protein
VKNTWSLSRSPPPQKGRFANCTQFLASCHELAEECNQHTYDSSPLAGEHTKYVHWLWWFETQITVLNSGGGGWTTSWNLPPTQTFLYFYIAKLFFVYVSLIFVIVFTNTFTIEIENYLVLLAIYLLAKLFFSFTYYKFLRTMQKYCHWIYILGPLKAVFNTNKLLATLGLLSWLVSWPYGIYNQMLFHLPPIFMQSIYNCMWSKNLIPIAWQKAGVIQVMKMDFFCSATRGPS